MRKDLFDFGIDGINPYKGPEKIDNTHRIGRSRILHPDGGPGKTAPPGRPTPHLLADIADPPHNHTEDQQPQENTGGQGQVSGKAGDDLRAYGNKAVHITQTQEDKMNKWFRQDTDNKTGKRQDHHGQGHGEPAFRRCRRVL